MRIAQVMLGKGFGGAERSFVDLCAALCRRGHEVLAVTESRGIAREHVAAIPGVECASIKVMGSWDVLARWRLRRHLAAYRPAVAQMHLARAATLAGPAARALGIPTLAKTHNYVDLKYYRAIDHLVATTEQQRRYLREHGVAERAVSVIPNFSSIPVQAPREFAPGAMLRVAAIGRMVHKKGFDVLFEALALAAKQDLAVSLALAGDGPESDHLHDQLDALGLREAVTFLGWQTDVVPILTDADVFVLPSRDEPFGIVGLEAMACGVPIIATTTDGPVTFLDRTTALLVPPDDPAAIAAALSQVALDPAGAAARARAARARFESQYSEAVVVQRYLDLYAELGVGSDETVG